MRLLLGDCYELLKELPTDSVDSVVTDPPYELGFMNKSWDSTGIAFQPELWAEVLRVLKPGGHLLSFGGSRTYHRMAVAIEDAGFEIRDQIMWIYGCLDEDTEVATSEGVKPYHKTKIGDTVLCYDTPTKTYSYQPILEIVEYDYQDTAYRIIGDSFEQVVSKNHRVIVEQNGIETFQYAETLQPEANIPILENLPELQKALYDQQSNTGIEKQNLLKDMCQCANREIQYGFDSFRKQESNNNYLRRLWGKSVETERMAREGQTTDLLSPMQRNITGSGVEETRIKGSVLLDERVGIKIKIENDGGVEPIMERRGYLPQQKRSIRESINKICSVSSRISRNGSQRRICNGTSDISSNRNKKSFNSNRGSSSYKSQCDGQCHNQSNAFQNKRRAQGIRKWSGHKTSLVRIVPFQYTGKVWCLRVPTGAFVAVRGGVAFPTGNSGFPKSHNISKAIDKSSGFEGEVIATEKVDIGIQGGSMHAGRKTNVVERDVRGFSDEAKQWEGWGTALKPAHEPIVVARKPLIGTVAQNVLTHGTGGINIDGSRVGTNDSFGGGAKGKSGFAAGYENDGWVQGSSLGRFPANVIHDGSDEVVDLFPDTGKSTPSKGHFRNGNTVGDNRTPKGAGLYGDGAWIAGSQHSDSGSAARFFYCAKASKHDRNEGLDGFEAKRPDERTEVGMGTFVEKGVAKQSNHHPTVKPTDLMRYLCRLITPPNGTILDPFMGSGSTGKAAVLEGFDFIGMEQNEEYIQISKARIESAKS